ncbi:MAG: glutaredoxin domain-containing protein [Candidatus Paceibacterota bacterium]
MSTTSHKVIIYSTPTCGYCHMAKDMFTEHNIPFTDKNVQADMAARQEMMTKVGGQSGVPVIDIDGTITIGFDEEKIKGLLGIN